MYTVGGAVQEVKVKDDVMSVLSTLFVHINNISMNRDDLLEF